MRLIIEIIATMACNRACSYCAGKESKIDCATQDHGKYSRPINQFGDYELNSGIINFSVLKDWILFQKINMPDFEIQLVITGGEPTLIRTLPDFVQWSYDNGFLPPIIYTNGRNIADLGLISDPGKKCKVILTKHKEPLSSFDRDLIKPPKFEDAVEFCRFAEIPHLIKILVGENDNETPCYPAKWKNVVIEGIKRIYSTDLEKMLEQKNQYPPKMDNSSPYKWRWEGYGDRISRERTKFIPSAVISVLPTGNVFNCHLFLGHPETTIYERTPINELQIQLAYCNYQGVFPTLCDTRDELISQFDGCDTLCELQHYVNLCYQMTNNHLRKLDFVYHHRN